MCLIKQYTTNATTINNKSDKKKHLYILSWVWFKK